MRFSAADDTTAYRKRSAAQQLRELDLRLAKIAWCFH